MKLWKKLLASGLVLTMSISLMACGAKGTTDKPASGISDSNTDSSIDTNTVTATPTVVPTEKEDITISFMAGFGF